MSKLKNKVFYTIFILLSMFLVTILFIYNYQNYNEAYKNVKNSLKRFNMNEIRKDTNINPPPEKPNNEDYDRSKMMVMDTIIYSVKIDDNNNIEKIMSHNFNNYNEEKIEKLATNIMNNNKKEYIGNLYSNKYSYNYRNNYITIIDNTNINNKLLSILKVSILILITMEIVIIFISRKITNWIIKPVVNSFNKQKQFVADASHELKTPLSVIIASAEALSIDNNKKWINNIQNESERMNKLISNLLDLARLENTDIKKEYKLNNISLLVEKSVLIFESIIYEKNINLDYEIEDNIFLNCNSEEIKQVMSIILDNACKHTYKDGFIHVILKNNKDEVLIKITNTGDMIPKGEEEKIFERFYRVDKSRNRNENRYGLGLAIAKKIVENHNGTIKAMSNEKETIFIIKLKKK